MLSILNILKYEISKISKPMCPPVVYLTSVAFCCACSCVPAEVYAGPSYIWDFFVLAQTKGLRKAYVSGNHPKEQYFLSHKMNICKCKQGFP